MPPSPSTDSVHPKNLMSLPTETLLDIINRLGYSDRSSLKAVGNRGIVSVLQMLPKPTFVDYIKRYENIYWIDKDPWSGGMLSRFSMKAALNLACARGHDIFVLAILQKGLHHTLENSSIGWDSLHGSYGSAIWEVRNLLHDGLEQAASHSQLSTTKCLLNVTATGPPLKLDNNRSLEYASVNGNWEIVQTLLDYGVRVKFGEKNPSAIALAARNGHEACLKLLIGQTGEVEKEKISPALSEAASNGHLSIVNYLLDIGVQPRPSESGLTALHLAAKGGNFECFQRILECGVEDTIVHCQNYESKFNYQNWSSLHFAVYYGHHNIVKYLLDIDHLFALPAGSAESLIPLAALSGKLEVLKLLLVGGLDVYGIYDGEPGLHLAVIGDHPELIKLLLQQGADLVSAMAGRQMQAPLHKAAFTGSCQAASLLLASKAILNTRDINGDTPLHIAASRGHHQVLELLLKAGANAEAVNNKDESPLRIAVRQNHEFCITALLSFGADIYHLNLFGESLLHYAHPSSIYILLSHGANLESPDLLGRTPLHIASTCGDGSALRHLLAANADVHARSGDGKTALHYAAKAGRVLQVKILLEWGADREAVDGEGKTPLMLGRGIVRTYCRAKIVNMLEDCGGSVERLEWWD